MASNAVFKSHDLPSAALHIGHEVAVGKIGSLTACFTNRTENEVKVRFAISPTNSPAPQNYTEFDAKIPANGVLERTGIALPSGTRLIGYASASGVSFNIWGFEE